MVWWNPVLFVPVILRAHAETHLWSEPKIIDNREQRSRSLPGRPLLRDQHLQRRSQQLTLDVIGSRRGYSSPVGDILPFLFLLPLLISYTPSLPTTIFSFYFFFPELGIVPPPAFWFSRILSTYISSSCPPPLSHVSYFFLFLHQSIFFFFYLFLWVCAW